MEKYRLIASDLDGTLLDGCSRVGEKNLRAIRELAERGVIFVPSTGRALSEIPDELLSLDCIRYIIYANGASVIDRVTGERIEACIDRERLNSVFTVLSHYDTHIAVRYKGETFVDGEKLTEADFLSANLYSCPAHVEVVRNYARRLENFGAWLSSIKSAEFVTVFFPDKDATERARRELRSIDGITTASVVYNNLEVMSVGAGKGNALRALSAKLGIPLSSVIAVGDSGNDITSMRASGLALAVSNATDEVKRASDAVICSNEEGIAEYILKEHF